MLPRSPLWFASVLLGALMAGCTSHIPAPQEQSLQNDPKAETPVPVLIPKTAGMTEEERSRSAPVRKKVEKKEPYQKRPIAVAEPAVMQESKPLSDTTVEILERKIDQNRTRDVRAILDKNPGVLDRVAHTEKKLLYIGPKGWRVIDIIEGLRKGKWKEKGVITHIKKAGNPYRVFSYEEIQFLLKQKLPYRVINTMMVVSR